MKFLRLYNMNNEIIYQISFKTISGGSAFFSSVTNIRIANDILFFYLLSDDEDECGQCSHKMSTIIDLVIERA